MRESAMRDVANRTFDEIEIGATEEVSRTLTATDVEALALAADAANAYGD